MKSALRQKDHEDLIRIHKKMTPEERLIAFYNHSRLMAQIYQAGIQSRLKKKHSIAKKKKSRS